MIEKRQKAIDIMNDAASLDFSGPVYRQRPDESVCQVTVWKRYTPLLLSLNSLMFTIDNQFLQIGRTILICEEIVSDICKRVLEEHTIADAD